MQEVEIELILHYDMPIFNLTSKSNFRCMEDKIISSANIVWRANDYKAFNMFLSSTNESD